MIASKRDMPNQAKDFIGLLFSELVFLRGPSKYPFLNDEVIDDLERDCG
jgi:hypothetical protein